MVSLTVASTLLLIAGVFTIYVSICLFMGAAIFGGAASTEDSSNHGTQIDYDPLDDPVGASSASVLFSGSLLHMLTLIAGIVSLAVALLGCCTGKTKDRCSVCCFSTLAFVLFMAFALLAGAMMLLHLQSKELIGYYCQGNTNNKFALGFVGKALLDASKP